MVAGGTGNLTLSSVEVLSNESSMSNEELAELPNEISNLPLLFLDGDNILLCGGYGNENTCLMHDNDSWKKHSNLNEWRNFASAVTTADGTFIFGGELRCDFGSEETFEFLPKNSKVWQEGRTRIPDGFSYGCALEVPEKKEILLVGGYRTYTRILKFDIKTQDFEEMNVSLIQERYAHTCARLPDTNLIVIT